MPSSTTRIPLDREWQNSQQLVKILSSAVAELSLDVRIVNALEQLDIIWVKDLVNLSIQDLTCIKNLGGRSIEQIVQALGEHGIELAKDARPANTSSEL